MLSLLEDEGSKIMGWSLSRQKTLAMKGELGLLSRDSDQIN